MSGADEFYRRGLESYTAGDHKAAASNWQAALDIDPNHAEARAGISRLQDVRSVRDPKSDALYRQALSEYLSGNKTASRDIASQAVGSNAKNLEALKLLQRMGG